MNALLKGVSAARTKNPAALLEGSGWRIVVRCGVFGEIVEILTAS
jgi:hypothetical protein